MPAAAGPLNVLALNVSLERSPHISNIGEVAELVLEFCAFRHWE
jgi:hypothetical protein